MRSLRPICFTFTNLIRISYTSSIPDRSMTPNVRNLGTYVLHIYLGIANKARVRLALSIFRLQCFTLETIRAKWQYSRGVKVALVCGFRKIGKSLAACLGFSWLRNETAAGRAEDLGTSHRVALVPFDLRAYVSELVKRIRLSVESHPRPPRFHLSRERVRFVESSNGLMVYTSWRCAFVKTRKSSRGRFTLWELASGQGDPPHRCRFTTSWKAICHSLGARLIFFALLRCTPRRRKSVASILFQIINSISPRVHTPDRSSTSWKSSNDYLFSFYQTFLKVPKTHFRVPRPFVELGSTRGKSLLHVQQITRVVIFNLKSSLQRRDCILLMENLG